MGQRQQIQALVRASGVLRAGTMRMQAQGGLGRSGALPSFQLPMEVENPLLVEEFPGLSRGP